MRPVGTGLFQTDGQTDVKKLIVALRNFAKSCKNETKSLPRFVIAIP